jgi:MoxR-like ATPase
VIVGHDEIVHGVLTCMFVGGHCLLEGVPGLGKTMLVRTLAETLDLDFNRIQFTPDLMPSDILGTNMVMETPDGRRVFEFQRGRSSRRSAWRTKSTAPRPRRSRPCWKRCRKGRSPSAARGTN